MDTSCTMIDCDNYINARLTAFEISNIHPSTDAAAKSKVPELILFREISGVQENVVLLENLIVWMRRSCSTVTGLPLDYKTFSIPDGIDFGLWCDFQKTFNNGRPPTASEQTEKQLRAFVFIRNSLLTAVSFAGDLYQSKLTVDTKSVWATSRYGLIVDSKEVSSNSVSLPTLYNLCHPCEELVPIVCCNVDGKSGNSQISDFTSSMKSSVVGSILSLDILVTHDLKKGHRFWIVRKATEEEKEEFYHQRELKMTELNATRAREFAKTPGIHHDKTHFTFSPISKSVFLTSHLLRSPLWEKQSPQFVKQRQQRLHSQQPLHHSSPFANNTLVSGVSGNTQLNKSNFVPWFEMPLTPSLCLEFITSEDVIAQKHSSKFTASKAFATSNFSGQHFICLFVAQIESLVLYQVKRNSRQDRLSYEITKCGSISCVDAVDVETLPYMAVLEKDSSLSLYSGHQKISKVRFPDIFSGSLNSEGVGPSVDNAIFKFHMSAGRNVIASTFGGTNIVYITLPRLFDSPCVELFLDSFRSYLSVADFSAVALKWFICRNAVGKNADRSCEFESFLTFLEAEIGFVLSETENTSMDSFDSSFKKVKMIESGCENDWIEMMSCDSVSEIASTCNLEYTKRDDQSDLQADQVVLSEHALLAKYFEQILQVSHVIYEECKLDVTRTAECKLLAIFLAKITHRLGLHDWKKYYLCDFPVEIFPSYLWKATAATSVQRSIGENISRQLGNFIRDGTPDFACWIKKMLRARSICVGSEIDQSGASMEWQETALSSQSALGSGTFTTALSPFPCIWGVTNRIIKTAILYYAYTMSETQMNPVSVTSSALIQSVLADLGGKDVPCELITKLDSYLASQPLQGRKESLDDGSRTLFLVNELQLDCNFIDSLPAGIALPFYLIVYRGHLTPCLNWPLEVIRLIKRQDVLAQKAVLNFSLSKDQYYDQRNSITPKLGSVKYYMNLEAHLSTSSKRTSQCSQAQAANTNGLEMDCEVLDVIFPDDCRVQSVKRMLNSAQAVKVKAHPQQTDLQLKLTHYAKRTMALPVGRGMFTLSSVSPNIAGMEPIPEINFSCRLLPKNITVQITSTSLSYPARSWAYFHNGAAAGLRIDQNIKDLDSAWVIYNRPKSTSSGEHASVHAGFLLGLALNGHLDNMSSFNLHSYLCRNRELTSVSLLLGLCASKQASADPVLERTITLHINALLPPNGTELDVGFNVQTAALLAAGFLYMASADKHMAQVMLNQINRPPGPEMENCINRESYSLAAGLSLGMILLGKGTSLFGVESGISFTSQLCSYIKGGANPHVHVQSLCNQIREGDTINLLVTSPGASLATGLIFFNSCSYSIADWFMPPETTLTIDTVLPEHLLLHVVAKSLICWQEVLFTHDWIRENLPEFLRPMFDQSMYSQDAFEKHGFDVSAWQAYCNIVSGSCFSLGLRFAGSQNKGAFVLVLSIFKTFLELFETGSGFDPNSGSRTVFSSLQTCLIAVCMIMSGTGNLKLLAIIRRLHCLVGPTYDYGQQMAVHMALGLLFLGGCRYSLKNDPPAVAALLAAFYPVFPLNSEDNRYHLQAFRHLYAKACEPRLLITRNVSTHSIERVLLRVVLKETIHYEEHSFEVVSPCLLPQLCLIGHVQLLNREPHYPFLAIHIDLTEQQWRLQFMHVLRWCLLVQCSKTHPLSQSTGDTSGDNVSCLESKSSSWLSMHSLSTRRGERAAPFELNFVQSFLESLNLSLCSVVRNLSCSTASASDYPHFANASSRGCGNKAAGSSFPHSGLKCSLQQLALLGLFVDSEISHNSGIASFSWNRLRCLLNKVSNMLACHALTAIQGHNDAIGKQLWKGLFWAENQATFSPVSSDLNTHSVELAAVGDGRKDNSSSTVIIPPTEFNLFTQIIAYTGVQSNTLRRALNAHTDREKPQKDAVVAHSEVNRRVRTDPNSEAEQLIALLFSVARDKFLTERQFSLLLRVLSRLI